MTKTIRIRMTRVVLVLLTAGLVAGCGTEAEAGGARQDDVLLKGAARTINVETTTVEAGEFVEIIRLTSTVRADQDVTISAEESGVIRSIIVDKGSAVTVGQWLFKIDDEMLQSQIDEAVAQASLTREIWERRKRLYEEDQVGSELAYLEAKYGAEQAAARLATLRVRLAHTVIRAPISGVLESRFVEVGTMVNVGTDVARIVSIDPVKIVAGVPERYVADVAVGATATVHFEILDRSVESTISYVGATVNPQNRTFLVELEIPNPDGVIKPEMIANLELVRQRLENVIVVPQEALMRVEDGYVAFVVEGEGPDAVAESRPVELGSSQQNGVVIESGLSPGDRLIVVGQQQVATGDHVKVVGTTR